MKNQRMGLSIIVALIIFLQAETSQARTVQNCSECTSKSCRDADDKEWCISNCDFDGISNCLKVTPKIKNTAEANRHGNTQRLELLHKVYKKFPLSKYFLDIYAPEEPGRDKTGTLNENEQRDLSGALKELEGGCQEIVQKLEYSKGKNLSAKTTFRTFNQVRDTLNKIKINFANINTSIDSDSIPTRWEVKIAFDKGNLDLKTCFNQGEGAVFEANQKESFMTKIVNKFSCSNCVAKECKTSKIFNKCVENCPAYRIESCIEAGTEAGFDVASENDLEASPEVEVGNKIGKNTSPVT